MKREDKQTRLKPTVHKKLKAYQKDNKFVSMSQAVNDLLDKAYKTS
jgi:hypothetical protein